jgi:hypothetical protein
MPGIKPHGIFVDLRSLDEVFVIDDDMGMDMDMDSTSETTFMVYPQAGLVTAGHFQAKGLMQPFHRLLKQFNHQLMDGCEDRDWDLDRNQYAVVGLSSQGYNAIMHNT